MQHGALMAQVLIGGTAALLICIFLSPKFIEFLRLREFGQHVRDDGPQGHLGKAGTPTMGGVLMFIAIAAPFAILSNWNDWHAIGVFGAAIACAPSGSSSTSRIRAARVTIAASSSVL